MKKTIVVISVILIAAWSAGFASAASWTKVGNSSTFTCPQGDDNGMGDYRRIVLNSVVADPAGNVFATTNGATTGGLTIWKADGSKVEVNLATAGYPGPVTKLVVGGDGSVYGLQNWLEIHWPGAVPAGGPYIPSRILKFTATGGVSLIKEYSPVTGTTVWTNRICGMTVSRVADGGDGNVYWTMVGNSNYTKYHYFWRYNTTSQVVEEAPINNHNNGHLEEHRGFDLEWVGVDPDDAENQLFAVVSETSIGGQWRMDPMGWKITNRPEVAKENGISDTLLGRGRDHITAMAYDRSWKKLIVGGRGDHSPNAGSNYLTKWANQSFRPTFFEKDDQTPDPYGDTNWFWINRAPAIAPANGNNDDTPNNGQFWVSAMCMIRDQGRVWIACTGDSTYNFDPEGTILSWDLGEMKPRDIIQEGVPEANSRTVGLTLSLDSDEAYALVCGKSTGIYSLYKKGILSITPISGMKSQNAGSVVMTDTPKLVTYTDPSGAYFYIQDDDHGPGIKVVPNEGVSIGSVGDRASVRGTLGVLDGEAVIFASSVTTESTLDVIAPVATAIRNIGGAQAGIQPPVYTLDVRQSPALLASAIGANTTGMRVRVVGKVYGTSPGVGFFLDDGSGYGIWVAYADEIIDNDTTLGVSGVSSTMWDTGNSVPVRVIRPNFLEITVY